MELVRYPGPFPVIGTLADAWTVYRLLFARSVFVAALVYALVAILQIGEHASAGASAALLGFVGAIAGAAGPLLVQGALIEIVRNVHEGRVPEPVGRLFTTARRRFWSLLWASLVYVFGIAGGLILFIVPGLLVVARWSLMPAVVMLEGRSVREARHRSRDLVRGHGTAVFACVVVPFLLIAGPESAIEFGGLGFGTATFLGFVWSSLTAPFAAHLLTVIYYRRSEAARPVIDPVVRNWRSVWEGR